MAASYDDVVTELHQAPHTAFVTERKRLAGELKAAGDKEGAARLAKLPRPPVSAWVVNQLWWHARDAFEAMLAGAERLRAGDLGAAAAHREAIGKLRARAAAILADAGHAGSEVVLRRVTTTLAAIAAAGGFAPDPAGALGEDRDPPGFETMGIAFPAGASGGGGGGGGGGEVAPRGAAGADEPDEADEAGEADETSKADEASEAEANAEEARRRDAEEARRRDAEEARARAEAAAERRRIEQEAARRQAERQRLEAALRTASGEVERLQRDITRLRGAVAETEDKLEKARAIAVDLEARIADLFSAASPSGVSAAPTTPDSSRDRE